jgi:hypothetical protein
MLYYMTIVAEMSEDGLTELQTMLQQAVQDKSPPFDDNRWLQRDQAQEYTHDTYDSRCAQG